MPALRKRKSRTGTPLATPADTPTYGSVLDPRKEKVQSSLDTWVEPALQNPAPSFEEHGFARGGVLEGMAPLGVPPSTKVKQKTRGIGDTAVRRSLLGGKSSALGGEEDGTTPEMTPAPEVERGDDSERQDEDEIPARFPDQEEDEDDDYMPAKKKLKTAQGVRTPVRGKSLAHSKTPSYSKTPVKNGIGKMATPLASPVTQTVGLYGLDQTTQQRIQIAVNDAIARSNKNGRRNVGMALKEMLEESREDPKLAKSLDGVIHQKQTTDDWGLFHQYIKAAKKNIKRQLRVQQAEEDMKATNEVQTSSPFNKEPDVSSPAAGIDGAANDFTTLDSEPVIAPTTETSKSIGLALEDAIVASESPEDPEAAAVAPHPLTTAPDFPATESTTPPARKMGSRSPRKRLFTNGNPAPDHDLDAAVDASTAAPTPANKSPDTGAGSDSGLSEVDEDVLKDGQPAASARANGNTASKKQKKPKNTALARAGKLSRANSMKPFAKPKEKPLTVEQLAEQATIRKRRDEFSDEQQTMRERMLTAAPTSDIRFDDEILETESLTESQIAVGPPVDANRPRRAGRPPRNGITVHTGGAKRSREDSRFSSPLPGSVAASRPSTPAAFSHVPSKRVKLNNGQVLQAARTKKSPVKNRDGPIAGIPHTGGGASRQSGPDDNDPGSPPSESDDLCSACKGSGEFVCCDNCPRVFHFLCCDPPRLDAPTGSFLCHEDAARLRPTEEPAAESFAVFGPLFKALESTNTRAFALPADLQIHFEDVAARPDGSYQEETKKFPLAKSSGYGYQRPDYTKVLDSDHKPILCTNCGLTSGGKRQMLKCDFCTSHWHLDCLSPPMANPPHINLESSHRDAWRCPRHIDHDLRSGYVVQADLNDVQDAAMLDAPVARLGRKVRKPRQPEIVQPTFSRGLRNNGLIEIINDADDDTDGEGNYVFGSEDKDINSQVYRVPEKGLVLDFISKVKGGRAIKKTHMDRTSRKAAAQRKASLQNFAARPIQQQQAALNLAKLAKRESDIGLHEHSVDALVLSLTAEAPNDVVAAISDAPPPPLADDERAQLLKLQELIKMRLGGEKAPLAS